MAFASIVIAELAFAYSCRSATLAAWRSGRATLLSWSVGASLCALAAALTAGPVRDLLGTVALTPAQLLVVVAAGLAPAAAVEVVKAARRRT
jgi:hypothetical protein